VTGAGAVIVVTLAVFGGAVLTEAGAWVVTAVCTDDGTDDGAVAGAIPCGAMVVDPAAGVDVEGGRVEGGGGLPAADDGTVDTSEVGGTLVSDGDCEALIWEVGVSDGEVVVGGVVVGWVVVAGVVVGWVVVTGVVVTGVVVTGVVVGLSDDVVSGVVVVSLEDVVLLLEVVVVTGGSSSSVTPGGGSTGGAPGTTGGNVAAGSRVPTFTLSSFHFWIRSVLASTSSTVSTCVLTACSFCCAWSQSP
jgi:hypothetical protein